MPDSVRAPLVSVITPTYNRAYILARALASVRGQSVADWEHIIIDDGSNDGTAALLREYDDSRLTYLYQDRSGASAARNAGIRQARGKYVAFLDSDDEWTCTKLARQLSAVRDAPDQSPCVVLTDALVVGANRVRRIQPRLQGEVFEQILGFIDWQGGVGSSLFLHRELAACVWFDEGLEAMQDWDFLCRAARMAPAITIEDPLVILHEMGTDRLWQGPRIGRSASTVVERYAEVLTGYPESAALQLRYFSRGLWRYGDERRAREMLIKLTKYDRGTKSLLWALLARVGYGPLRASLAVARRTQGLHRALARNAAISHEPW